MKRYFLIMLVVLGTFLPIIACGDSGDNEDAAHFEYQDDCSDCSYELHSSDDQK